MVFKNSKRPERAMPSWIASLRMPNNADGAISHKHFATFGQRL